MHKLQEIPFTTWYTDIHNDLLPINNDNNFSIALSQTLNHAAKPLLRLFIQRKGGLIVSARLILMFKYTICLLWR